MHRHVLVSIVVLSLLLTGCTSYYVIKDPSSGKTFYATDIDKLKDGAVTFKDESTGAAVTLQNSEVRQVDEDQYLAGLKSATPPAK